MKYLVLLAAVLIQCCLGGLYAWSSMALPLQEVHGLSSLQTQLIFGFLIAVFTLATVFAGRLIQRYGPQRLVVIAALLFGLGYVLASLSAASFYQLFLGIALLSGIATGMGYVVSLSLSMQWFPAQRGLITGIVMAGFGGGAIVLSALITTLLAQGMDILVILRWIGLSYGLTLLLAALPLRLPTSTISPAGRSLLSITQLLRERHFCTLALCMFCGTFAGLLVIGTLKHLLLSQGIQPAVAAISIGAFAAGNFSGRIFWGWAADRFTAGLIPVSLLTLALALALLQWTATTTPAAILASLLVGFGFAACFVIYAAQVARQYGPDRVSSIYPFIFLAYGAAGKAGPLLGGWLYDATGTYTLALTMSIIIVLFAALSSIWLLGLIFPARVGQNQRACPERDIQSPLQEARREAFNREGLQDSCG